MNARKRYLVIAAAVTLASCGALPRALKDEIASEHDKLQQAQRQLQNTASDAKYWPDRLRAAQAELDRARADGVELDKLVKDTGRIGVQEARRRAESLLREERGLRQSALRDSDALERDAKKRRDFEQNPAQAFASIRSEYEQIHNFDLTSVAKTVEKAGQDWPAKKADLEARLSSLRQIPDKAASEWHTAESTPVSPDTIPVLIGANDDLAKEDSALTSGASQLKAMTGQLYVSWDKILVDLDKDPAYREKVKTVTTNKGQVTSSEAWVDISPASYRSLDNDIGMSIAHKDVGLYDSEAVDRAQPPGYAYIATPEQGRNQYGYWAGGVWTWLPEYLLMRELFWGRSYQPIYINEYHGYQTAVRSGRTYYGQESPTAPPKYGSHGTFTEQRYAGSRYMQSGGFRGSGYSSSSGGSAPASSRPSSGYAAPESSAGKRFGSGGGGHQFGRTPSPRPSARSFGRRR